MASTLEKPVWKPDFIIVKDGVVTDRDNCVRRLCVEGLRFVREEYLYKAQNWWFNNHSQSYPGDQAALERWRKKRPGAVLKRRGEIAADQFEAVTEIRLALGNALLGCNNRAILVDELVKDCGALLKNDWEEINKEAQLPAPSTSSASTSNTFDIPLRPIVRKSGEEGLLQYKSLKKWAHEKSGFDSYGRY